TLAWNPADYQIEDWRPEPVGNPELFQPGEVFADRIENIVIQAPRGYALTQSVGALLLRAVGAGPAQVLPQPVPVSPFISQTTGFPQAVAFEGAVLNIGPDAFDPNAETPWRHVAQVAPGNLCPTDPASGCPAAPSWTSQRLFAPAGGGQQVPALNDFCIYERPDIPDALQLNELTQLEANSCVMAMAPDRLVVAPMGATQISDVIAPALRADFLDQAGQPLANIATPSGGVRLAIVDTQPASLLPPGNAPHGFALRAMARDLLCAGGACNITIETALGLPMRRCDSDPRSVCRDDALGGDMATQSQLAAAIRQATADWVAAAPADRLVINLSVAWHPRYGSDPADGPSVQAVYAAIRDARCRGAQVVASVGNRINEPDPFPPADALLPAAWERLSTPDFAECSLALELAPSPADFPGVGDYAPLLLAAGAV
ncbi:MAG: hypothetical protein AAFR44_09165, partial [Pseudomonadota bacterium]